MSKFMDKLKELAGESDEAKRVELAGAIDKEADELDEKWSNKDAFASLEKERDDYKAQAEAAGRERDDWKLKYADKFFGGEEKQQQQSSTEQEKPAKVGIEGLWQ